MSEWVRDGHRVSLEVYGESVSVRVMCPGEEMCKSATRCSTCEGEGEYANGPFDDGGPTYRKVPCNRCDGTGYDPEFPCHLTHWAQCTSAIELHDGTAHLDGITFPAEIRWRYCGDEGPEWRYANAIYEDEVEA